MIDLAETQARLDQMDVASNPIEFLLNNTFYNNGDIAKRSGMSAKRVRSIREGARANAVERAALKWVLARHLLKML